MAAANTTKQAITGYGSSSGGSFSSLVFSIDPIAVLKAAVMGGIFMAPLLRLFYSYLDRSVKGTLPKTLIDQFLAAWVFNTYAQWVLSFLNNEPFDLSMKMVHLVMLSWLWWIPLKIIMFQFVPVDLQVPFNACGSFGWNIIMFFYRG